MQCSFESRLIDRLIDHTSLILIYYRGGGGIHGINRWMVWHWHAAVGLFAGWLAGVCRALSEAETTAWRPG